MEESVKKTKKISKEALAAKRAAIEETLLKKRRCNKKAAEIVEYMIENQIDENWLLENARFINQSHYQDVTEERALSRLCGYPLCDKFIEKVFHTKFSINLKAKKVYDLENRKNFCSNVCFEKSSKFKDQLLNSPLWLREKDDAYNFKIIRKAKGSSGDEVPFMSFAQPEEDEEDSKVETMMSSFASLKTTEAEMPKPKEQPTVKTPTVIPNPVDAVVNALRQWFTDKAAHFLHNRRKAENDFPAQAATSTTSKFKALRKELEQPAVARVPSKSETLKAELKVRAFFGGKWEYAKDEGEVEAAAEAERSEESGEVAQSPDVFFPLVDAKSQNALRRRIVLNYLEKGIPSVLGQLGLGYEKLSADLKRLVDCFHLTAETITFRPPERDLLSLLLVTLLSQQNNTLKERMEESDARLLIGQFLAAYNWDATSLDRFVDELLGSFRTG